MLRDAIAAFEQILSPPFRSVLWKSLALSLALLVLGYVALAKLGSGQIVTPWPWLDTWIAIALGFGLFIGMSFLVAPVSALVAGFFLDDLAEIVERVVSPHHLGRPLANAQAVWLATKFAALSLLVNFFALILLLVPGINLVAFIGANAYLLSREYFELAALRYRPLEEVRALRARTRSSGAWCPATGYAEAPDLPKRSMHNVILRLRPGSCAPCAASRSKMFPSGP